MKKWFSVLLVVVLLFSSTALADEPVVDFSIRNGVKFGDSVDDVKSKDGAFSNSKDSPYSNFVYDPVTFFATKEIYPHSLSEDIELANAPVTLYYMFTDAGLKEILYMTSTNAREKPSMQSLESAYDVLEKALVEKYGEKLSPDDPLTYMIEAPGVGEITRTTNGVDPWGSPYSYIKVQNSTWLVKYNDYSVKIDLYCYRTDASSVYFGLSYYMITNSEMEAIVQEYSDKVNQFVEEVNNSI